MTGWIILSLHFATNVVREHYPALTLIDHGHFQLDEYAGFHADIFEHRDGHHYIGNQVAGSVVAAVPLLLFKPLLDFLQEVGATKAKARSGGAAEYKTEYPGRAKFFEKVRERGLDLKFGAVTAITTVFLMAPLCALFGVLIFNVLRWRQVEQGRAIWLSLLFVFGTPIFYRAATLNHNLMFAFATFGAFLLLWRSADDPDRSWRVDLGSGLLAGSTVALDYAGAIVGPALYAYLAVTRYRTAGVAGVVRSTAIFVAGCLPPFVFLWVTQWWMYGHPLLPGQFWMPNQNEFVGEGTRGFTAPDPEIFWQNLFSLDWGLYTFGPLLLLGAWPVFRAGDGSVFPSRERRFAWLFMLGFMLFCASNQYSRLQWNTGFRYLLPLVPFAFLMAANHLHRMPSRILAVVTGVCVVHTWVLSMVRYTPPSRHVGAADYPAAVPESWLRFFEHGVQFPWLTVLRSTPSLAIPGMRALWFPYALLALTGLLVAFVWWVPLPQRKRT